MPSSVNRRHFLGSTLAATAAGLLPATAAANRSGLPWQFCTFTKSLQHLPYDDLAARIATLGFDGVEVPVRPQGHIEPAAVEDELPKLVDALRKHGLGLTVMTSGINEVSGQQRTEPILRTAAALGIRRFRMNYYKYDLKKPIPPQIDEVRPRLRDLVALCRELGIKPVYQNHSGSNYLGAPVWDLHLLLQDHDPAHLGMAFDIGHATIEGATCWPIHWALVRPWIDTVYVKEPRWGDDQRPKPAPLGTGGLNPAFFKTLKTSGFTGPISLHVEYLDHNDPSLEPAFLEATRKDFATLQNLLRQA